MDSLRQNLRHTLRAARRSPGFTAVAILTLALGIGAVVAMFTVVNDVVLQPLSYPQSERLVAVTHPVPGEDPDRPWGLSSGGYFFFAENSRALDELGVYDLTELTLATGETAQDVNVAQVSSSLFEVLRATPALGRLLRPDDNRSRAFEVAVLDHGFWESSFGGDPAVVGRTIHVEGTTVEIVGVAEPGLGLPDQDVALWMPVRLEPGMYHANWHRFRAIGRLRDGVSTERAESELARLTERLPEAVPTAYSDSFMENTGFTARVRPLREEVVGGADRMLWILLGAVGVVLLIACTNVTNLFLVRMEGRRREVAIRTALGASSRDLAGRYLIESTVLALCAGAIALGLAHVGIESLAALGPTNLPRLTEVGIGWDSVAFTAVLAAGTGIAFGLLPLLRGEPETSALREDARGVTASKRQHALRGALVVGEISLALVLLAAAGLMLQTFRNLRAVDTGIDAENALTLKVSLPQADYPSHEAVTAFFRELTTQIAGRPGVRHIGATQALPLSGAYDGAGSMVFPEDWNAREERYPLVSTPRVTPGYFSSLGIAVRGRVPNWTEIENRTAGVVVSRAFAESVWPGEDPIGKGIRGYYSEQPHFRVVGVAENVRAAGLDRPPVEAVYFPLIPAEGIELWPPPGSMTLVVGSNTSHPEQLTAEIRRIASEIDPGVAIGQVRRIDEVIASHGSVATVSLTMLLLGIAAGLALLLGMIGLYGVISYLVEQRRGEIGIRRALGAGAAHITGMIVGQSARLVVPGVLLGLAGAILTTRILRALLFEVSPTDPVTLAGVSLLLIGVAVLAAYLPARRAARVDPMIALRNE